GAVVDGHDLDAGAEAGRHLTELGLDAVDDRQNVLAVSHDDDARHRFAEAVEVGDTAAEIGAEADLSEILDANRCSVLARRHGDVLEVGDRACVAAATHHVLGAAELDQAAAGLAVPAAHRLDDPGDRQSEGAQAVWIQIHLILTAESADRSDLGDARDGLEVIPEVPGLDRPQIGEAGPPGALDERVTVHPA